MKKLILVSLICVSLFTLGFTVRPESYNLQLQVPTLAQSWNTSCGEAALVMVYNYAFPQQPLKEADVIQFAINNGYYTPDKFPFTTPADMANILENYTEDYTGGNVTQPSEGVELLLRNLYEGRPVIIDITTHLDRPGSSAHFVVVTGLLIDRQNKVTIYYNDPLTGRNESAPWDGKNGVWNAWKNNGDPGGSGWWLVISSS